MARPLPQCVDTVIVGNGPSALVLSYILHGHIPYYIGGHHDALLDAKLRGQPNLLHLTPDLHAHFLASLRYSTQALPVNTLLDTLLRPNADTDLNPTSCIEWRYEPHRAVSHVAVGDTEHVGGQWAENPVSASADIATLSYAEQLSLPGYSYADHLARTQKDFQCDFVRPSRSEFAEYLRAYPEAVGISGSVFTGMRADQITRSGRGFSIGSLGIHCKHLVLASGIFTVSIPPPPLLAPIAPLHAPEEPLLVVGSGFSAADIIISAPTRKIIHLFQWAPDKRPSPLRACHHTAYPEYAMVYRQMKIAAIGSSKGRPKPSMMRKSSLKSNDQRDWSLYEGLPNAEIVNVSTRAGTATVTIRLASGKEITRSVGGLEYVVGRRGTTAFLSGPLQAELLSGAETDTTTPSLISGRTLRPKAETTLEVARNVFITGSLTGDSLIRHAVGGCVFAAGRILGAIPTIYTPPISTPASASTTRSASPASTSASDSDHKSETTATSPGGSRARSRSRRRRSGISTPSELTNGHADLHLDRRKLTQSVEVAMVENRYWVDSGWWAGGLGPRWAG